MLTKLSRSALVSALAAGTCLLTAAAPVASAGDTNSLAVASSIKVAVDKETGKLRALTKEEESALSNASSVSGAELSVRLGMPATSVVFPAAADGTVRAQLGTDMFDQLVATTDESGAVKITHQSVAAESQAGQEEK
jgi:hypothetical protein